MRLNLLFLALVFIQASCSSKLNETKLNPKDMPLAFKHQDRHVYQTKKQTTYYQWWQAFHCKELNHLIQSAIHHNATLKQSIANIEIAKAYLQKIQFSWLPTVSMGGFIYRGELSNVNVANNASIPLLSNLSSNPNWPYYGYASGFVPSYSINFLEKYQNQIMAKQDLNAKIALHRSIRLAIISQVSACYFNVLASKQQLYRHQELLKHLKKQEQYALVANQYGAKDVLELENIRTKIAKFSKNIPQIKHNINESTNALKVLVGNPNFNCNFSESFDRFEDKFLVPLHIPLKVIEQRPDIQEAKFQLEKDHAQIARASAKLLPSFNISTFWGNGGLYFGNLFSLTTKILQGQLAAIMPLIDGSIFMEIKQAKAIKCASFYHYIGSIHQALSEIDTALSRRKHLFESEKAIHAALTHAKYRYQLNKNKVSLGASSNAEILPIQIEIDKLESQRIEIKQQQFNSLITLYQSLGLGA
jgi:multidrug efflux system outer membrane protein